MYLGDVPEVDITIRCAWEIRVGRAHGGSRGPSCAMGSRGPARSFVGERRVLTPATWRNGRLRRWEEVGQRARCGPLPRERGGSRPISRVLSRTTIHLGRTSPCASSDLPGSPCGPQERTRRSARFPIWSCSRWGLPCRRMLPPARCALTAPFHPCRHRIAAALRRFAFCCTVRGLAPPRHYLAPCPVEPGLSSTP